MSAHEEYLTQIRNCEIGADEVLAAAENHVGEIRDSARQLKELLEAIDMGLAAALVEEVTNAVDTVDDFLHKSRP